MSVTSGGSLRLVTLAACGFALANALWSAWDQSWTYDEPWHLGWSQRFLATGDAERDSAERVNSKTPIMIPHVLLRKVARALSSDPQLQRFAARLPSVLGFAGLLLATLGFARRLAGPLAAELATIAVALDPNLAAHGSLATVDTLYALATLLVLWAALALAESPSLRTGAGLGLSLGFAFTVKLSAVLLVLCVLLLPLLVPGRWRSRRALLSVLAAAALACAFVCASYLFRDLGSRLDQVPWRSRPFATLAVALPALRLPVPAAFLTGIDRSIAWERGEWNAYLFGRIYPHGVAWYFLALWLLKTPLLLLLGQAAGLARLVRERPLGALVRYLLLVLAVHLLYFSCFFHAQIGFRFVLMCVVIVDVLAAAGLARLAGARWAARAGMAVVVVSVLEVGFYFGNPLAFTNVAVQPKAEVFRLLADSNLDWGQNRDKIEAWLAKRGQGLSRLDPVHVLPGHNTLSVNVLAGIRDLERHRWVREHLTPLGHLGHTYVTYDASDEEFERLLAEARRLEPLPAASTECRGADFQRLRPGGALEFSIEGRADLSRMWLACVSVTKPVDFALRAEDGLVRLGPWQPGAPCGGELIGKDQSAWYRLEPGLHVLCAVQAPPRRAWLAAPFSGRFVVRRHGASVSIRQVAAIGAAAPPSHADAVEPEPSPDERR